MQALPTKTKYNLLKKNLPVAELLYQVAGFNFKTDEGLMEYVFGNNDMTQWQVKEFGENCVIPYLQKT